MSEFIPSSIIGEGDAHHFVVNRFVPTVVYARETAEFHTRLCIYNYFSELFPDILTGATANLWFFNSNGVLVANRSAKLPFKGQLQFDLGELGISFEGTAAVSLVPDTVPAFSHKGVGTGYYVYYFDNLGHADFSHEWEPMRFQPSHCEPWLCVVRPLQFPDTQLVVMSCYYGDNPQGTAKWFLRLRNGAGRIVSEVSMPDIPPCGCTRFALKSVFPDIESVAKREGTIAVEAKGTNIQGPFTWVTVPGGDFNIHHFC